MKILRASEDYLEAMLMMKEKHGYIRSIDVAEHLGVTKPSVTYTTKRLRESGYITMDKDGLITLSEQRHADRLAVCWTGTICLRSFLDGPRRGPEDGASRTPAAWSTTSASRPIDAHLRARQARAGKQLNFFQIQKIRRSKLLRISFCQKPRRVPSRTAM